MTAFLDAGFDGLFSERDSKGNVFSVMFLT